METKEMAEGVARLIEAAYGRADDISVGLFFNGNDDTYGVLVQESDDYEKHLFTLEDCVKHVQQIVD